MNPFEMVVAIIFLVVAGRVLREHLRSRAPGTLDDPAQTVELRAELRALKDRIAVLERVVTDNHTSLDLDREIARLRDR